ncbi:MAG: ABC transporter substrate-binding protein [Chloroflexi bacterium]|nr:ABC transporter substrate-binding protein [Chloroflexota bacterium]MCL5074089.1 ABC transporter substrate-binding protein [Chloroflexota bacterium]
MAKRNVDALWSNSMTRRDFLKTGLVAGTTLVSISALGSLAAGCAPAAPKALERITVQLLWIKNVEFGGYWAAIDKGYYKEEGLDVIILPGGPQVDVLPLISAGTSPIGLHGGADRFIMSVVDQGMPLRCFATNFQKAPSALMSLPEKPITKPADLIGKKIGLQTGARGPFSTILAIHKIPPEKVEIVPVGFDPTPLLTKQCDAYWCYATNQPYMLKEKGINPVVWPSYDAGYKFYGNICIAQPKTLEKNEDMLVRWLRASIKGWEYNNAHLEEIAKLTVEKYGQEGLSLQQQIWENEAQLPYTESPLTKQKGLFWMDPKVWQEGIELLVDTGQLKKKDAKVDDLITLEVLEKAYGGKTHLL